jgi:hypothetical protein
MKTMMRSEVRQLVVAAVQTRPTSMIAAVGARRQSSVASAAAAERVISDDIQDGPSTTVVETSVESRPAGDAGQTYGKEITESAASSGCPMAALRQMRQVSPTAAKQGTLKAMGELRGPIGWPIVGNFLTYLKKENQGKMHEVQVQNI